MRQNRLMLVMAIVLTFGLASFAAAQMMGGDHNHSGMNKDDSTAHSGMMGEGMMMKMGNMMGDMSKHCKMMSHDLDDLQTHFEKMMMMDDMEALKAEMQKHHDMMTKMHDNMSEQRTMCENMRSMMHSARMHGMGDADSTKSDSGDAEDQDQ